MSSNDYSKLKNKYNKSDLLESEYFKKERNDNFTFEEKIGCKSSDQNVSWLHCNEVIIGTKIRFT